MGSERTITLMAATFLVAVSATGQAVPMPPFIDMHVHSTNTTPEAVFEAMRTKNLRFVFLAALAPDVAKWNAAIDAGRLMTGLVFPCPGGRHIFSGRACYGGPEDFPGLAWLRREIQSGRIRALGELTPQYMGISPSDPRVEPYWKLAEEFDIPVGIHMGPGPAGVAYGLARTALAAPQFRMSMGDPLLLEDVLLRHKKLRVFVMHAGWPRLEPMIALLQAHPQVYVDVAALSAPYVVPRVSYYRYLRELVENGFGKRIMFGSDFPREVDNGVAAIMNAGFLSAEQKADILCNNAARFLKLGAAVCQEKPVPRGR
jgi:hypothetical protein